ncbi:Signal recognition particle 19 kDa protein [Ananas comosus]|uniref:Signal recognition particle 19 kDa protein n=1 Tax=Ananas comosus TaxID=4615 RepID=A0A199W9D6_ANACO|nr:Signal recognition particle 19 kDa protein [Ananas comosus]
MDEELCNIKKWIIIYPVYVNSKKTIAEGRRISAANACENPTCIEISDCCAHLKLPHAIELDKAYPRDFMQRGGSECRKQLMLQIAELIPKHQGRIKKQEPASSSATAGTSKSGKGGKKKK